MRTLGRLKVGLLAMVGAAAAFVVPVAFGAGPVELIANGGFESGDFSGWTVTDTGGGNWSINDGTFDPVGPGLPMAPVGGSYDAVTSQTGSGLRVLSQTVTVPDKVSSATLSWSDRIRNQAAMFSDPGQEFRVVLRDTAGGLLHEVFSTNPGDPLQQPGPNARSYDLTAVLQGLAGTEVVVSFEEQDALFFFNATIDDVSLLVESISTKADVLGDAGVPGQGIESAAGLQKEFNENSKAAENAGKK